MRPLPRSTNRITIMKNDSFQNSSYLEHLQELSELLRLELEAREETASLPVRACVPPVPSPLGPMGEAVETVTVPR
jgi:hypothetical protein